MAEAMDAGRLEITVLADLSRFARDLRTKVRAAAAEVKAQVEVEIDADALRGKLQTAVKAASAGVTAHVDVSFDRVKVKKALTAALVGSGSNRIDLNDDILKPILDGLDGVDVPTQISDNLIVELQRRIAEAQATAKANPINVPVKVDAKGAGGAGGGGLLSMLFGGAGGGANAAGGLFGGGGGGLARAGLSMGPLKMLLLPTLIQPAAAAITSLGAGIFAMGAAAAPAVGILGALPGVIGALGTAAIGTTIATKGFGQALSTALELAKKVDKGQKISREELDRLKEVMGNLTPSARTAVRGIVAVRKEAGKLRRAVQESFFSQFAKDIEPTAKILLPTLQKGFKGTGREVGGFVKAIGDWLRMPATQNRMAIIFEDVNYFIGKAGDAAVLFFNGLQRFMVSAGPLVRRFGDYLVKIATGFDTAMAKGEGANGSIARFLDKAVEKAKGLWRGFRDVLGIIGGLGRAASGSGTRLNRSFGQWLDKMDKFVNSKKGQKRIKKFFDDMEDDFRAVVGLLGDLVGGLVDLGESEGFKDLVDNLRYDLGPALKDILDVLGQEVGARLLRALSALGRIFDSMIIGAVPIVAVLEAIVRVLELLADVLELPGLGEGLGVIVGGLAALALALAAFKGVGKIVRALVKPLGTLFGFFGGKKGKKNAKGFRLFKKGVDGTTDALNTEMVADKKKVGALAGVDKATKKSSGRFKRMATAIGGTALAAGGAAAAFGKKLTKPLQKLGGPLKKLGSKTGVGKLLRAGAALKGLLPTKGNRTVKGAERMLRDAAKLGGGAAGGAAKGAGGLLSKLKPKGLLKKVGKGGPAAIAAGLGADWLGGKIDDGRGGARSVGGGALKGAAMGAGLGATAGLIGGPLAPVTAPIGAAVGGVIGGVIGGISKTPLGPKIGNWIKQAGPGAKAAAAGVGVAAGVAIKLAGGKSKPFKFIGEQGTKALSAAKGPIKTGATKLGGALADGGKAAASRFGSAVSTVGSKASGAINGAKNLASGGLKKLGGLFGRGGDDASKKFGTGIDHSKSKGETAINGVTTMLGVATLTYGTLLSGAGTKLMEGLASGIDAGKDIVGGAIGGVAGFVKDHWPFSPAKVGPLKGNPLKEAGTNLVGDLASGIEKGQGLAEKAAYGVADGVRKFFPFSPAKKGPLRDYPLDYAGQTLLFQLAKGIKKATPEVLGQISDLAHSMLDALRPEVSEGALAKAFANMPAKAAAALAAKLEKQVTKLDKLAAKYDTAAAKLEDAKSALASVLEERSAFATGVRDTFSAFGQVMASFGDPETGMSTTDQVIEALRTRVETAKKFATDLATLTARGLNNTILEDLAAQGPGGTASAAANALANASAAQLSTINQLQTQLATTGQAAGTNLGNRLFAQQVSEAQQLVDKYKAEVKALGNQMTQLGKNIGLGLLAGIQATKPQLSKEMKGLAKDLADEVRKILKIKSPSRVFDKIGLNTILGLVNRVRKERPTVRNAARGIATTLSSVPMPDLSAGMGNLTAAQLYASRGGMSGLGAAGSAMAPLFGGDLNIPLGSDDSVREKFEDVLFELRRIRRGGVHVPG